MKKNSTVSMLCIALLGTQLGTAQVSIAPAATSASTSVAASPNAIDLKLLQDRIAQQEEQIKRLQQAVDEQQKLLERSLANQEVAAAASANAASSPMTVATSTNGPVRLIPAAGNSQTTITPAGQGSVVATRTPGGPSQRSVTNPGSALSITLGNTTFTPLGFVDATFFGRSTNVGSGIGTNFGSIPYSNSATGHLSEANFSTQNSRVGFRVDSTFLGAKVLGYFEADFLGNQPATVFVTSNADTFRMRNVFVDVQKDGFEFLGGQDWSMMTPNRKGLSPLPSDIFYTQNMDTNYQAGLVWARQTQFRFIAHPNENLAFGVSLENPEQYVGGPNGSGSPIFPTAFNSAVTSQFNNGSGTNYSAPNLHPDIIFKGAYDGHVGQKAMHVEAAGLVRSFKFVNGVGTPAKFTSYSTTAASGSVNANLEVAKNFRLIANTFFGSGNGRYAFGQAPDVIVRADGSISPIHTYSTVDGFEATLTKNTLLYAYYGGIYIGRNVAYDANGKTLIGYGFRGSASSQNRAIQEGTIGVVKTFWKNPNYGALSLITQYSYLTRDPWAVATGAPKETHTNMYWVDLRYTLP